MRLLMKGNEAVAQAALRAGCRHYFGYPITPQNEIGAYMSRHMPELGGVFLQAESEIAAINMVLGASAAGARVMTSTSSPGMSLKTEGISYIAGGDLPAVIVNVQRGGPGLGSIQPAQSDYFQATKAPGHGDLRLPVFAPATVQEMADDVALMFDLTDRYRTPGIILADGLLGQMMEPVEFPGTAPEIPHKPWATNGHAGSRPKNVINSLYLDADQLEATILERFERYDEIEKNHARAERFQTEDAQILLVAYGACARIARSAVHIAREQGLKVGLLRPRTLWPFPKSEIFNAAKTAKAVLTVEMSRGQMVDDVKLAIEHTRPVHFYGRTGGIVPTPEEILAEITKLAEGAKA